MSGDINSPNFSCFLFNKHCHPILEPKAEITHFVAGITHVFEGITHVIALISHELQEVLMSLQELLLLIQELLMSFNELLVSLKEFLMAFSYHCSSHISIFNGELHILKIIRL